MKGKTERPRSEKAKAFMEGKDGKTKKRKGKGLHGRERRKDNDEKHEENRRTNYERRLLKRGRRTAGETRSDGLWAGLAFPLQ